MLEQPLVAGHEAHLIRTAVITSYRLQKKINKSHIGTISSLYLSSRPRSQTATHNVLLVVTPLQ
jgi:hypothetical protein